MDINSILGKIPSDISSLVSKLPAKDRAEFNKISQNINKVLSGTKIDFNTMSADQIIEATKRQQEAINKINDEFTNKR